MKIVVPGAIAAFSIAAVVLAGCSDSSDNSASGNSASPSSNSTSSSPTPSSPTSSTPASSAPASSSPASDSATDIATAGTSLGTVIVDGKGLTAYMFTKDKQGTTTSACTGSCAQLWPAITTTAAKPSIKGVTGKVGTIATTGGGRQITVNGWPIYTFASDKAAGDVTGQNVGQVWFVLNPAGKPVMHAAASSDSGY